MVGLVGGGDSGIADFSGGVHGVERIEKAPARFGVGAFWVQVFGTWFMGVSATHNSCTETVPSIYLPEVKFCLEHNYVSLRGAVLIHCLD